MILRWQINVSKFWIQINFFLPYFIVLCTPFPVFFSVYRRRKRLKIGPVIGHVQLMRRKRCQWFDVIEIEIHARDFDSRNTVVAYDFTLNHVDDGVPIGGTQVF